MEAQIYFSLSPPRHRIESRLTGPKKFNMQGKRKAKIYGLLDCSSIHQIYTLYTMENWSKPQNFSSNRTKGLNNGLKRKENWLNPKDVKIGVKIIINGQK